MYERFTDRARLVVQQADQIACYLNHEYIGTEHILLSLFEEGSGVAANVLRNLFIDLGRLYQEVEKLAQSDSYSYSRYNRPQTPRVKQLLADANEEAELLDASYVGTEHLLLALVRQVEGVAAQALMNLGLNLAEIRSEVLRILGCEIPVEKRSNVPPSPRTDWPTTESDRRIAREKSAMYERFTDRARKVLQLANQEAQRFNHEYVGTEHILLGLMKEGAGVAANVLKNLDIDLGKIRLEVEKIVLPGPNKVTMGKLPQTPRVKKAIEFAIEEARTLNHNYVGTEHLLLGLLREGENVGAQVLMNLGLRLEDVRREVLHLLGYNIASEKSFRGWYSAGRWLRSLLIQDKASGGSRSGTSQTAQDLSAENERIRSLEQQLWNVRIVLGGVVGAIAGALLLAQFGAIMGLLLGGSVAAIAWRSLGILTGGVMGVLLGYIHLPNDGGGLAGALLGALVGFLITEIGAPPGGRGFLGFWRKR